MAVIKLESLVLRGSTVLLGGTAGNPRLGASCAATPKTPEVRISMRGSSLDWKQEFSPAMRLRHTDYFRVDAFAAYGAGRSHSRPGVLRRSRLRPYPGSDATRVSAGATSAAIPAVWRQPAKRTEQALS